MTRLKLLSAALLLLFGEKALAQSYTWQQTSGPEGGIVDALMAVDSLNLLLSIDGGNAYRSTSGGLAWSLISSMPGYPYAFGVNSTGHLFSGGAYGMNRSTDGGATWSKTGITSEPSATLRCFCLDSSGRMYAGSYAGKGMFRSTDGGASWVSVGLTSTTYIWAITAIKTGAVFACTNLGVYRSTDGGVTWPEANNGLTSLDVRAMAANQSLSLLFAATSGGGVYRSDDGGNTWAPKITGLTTPTVYALDIGTSAMLFAMTPNGVFRSIDNANNWSIMSNNGLISAVSHLVANSRGLLVVGNAYGVFRSPDFGNNWVRGNTGIKGAFVYAVAANANGYIFAGAHGIFRSSDLGSTWTSVGSQDAYTRLLASSPTSAVYASTDVGVYRSTDDGNAWSPTPLTSAQVLAVAPSGAVFAGHSSAMLRSTNGGVSWDSINTGLPKATRRAIAISPAGVVYVSVSGNGLYRTSNNGTTWTLTTLNQESLSLCFSKSGFIFAGTGGSGVYRSTDDGQNWTVLNGLSNVNVNGLLANSKGDIFANTGSMYQSTEAGGNWTFVSVGTGSPIMSLAVTTQGTLVVGSGGSGVFRGTPVASAIEAASALPVGFALEQNYPNPFNPSTIINYQLSIPGRVMLRVFNAIGQEVALLVNEQKDAGTYSVRWDAEGAPSGIYFYRLQAGDRLETKKMVYLR